MPIFETRPAFEAWDVVKVPFPYTDRPVRQRRPALVIAAGLGEGRGLLWVLMIISAENRGWAGDVEISNPAAAGLPAPSVIRTAKIVTIEARDAERIGGLPAPDRLQVRRHVLAALAES